MIKSVGDLGIAAYLKMHGFHCVGRKGRDFYFEFDENQSNEFDELIFEYTNSQYHTFDGLIMSLKKLPQYLASDKT